MEAECLWLRRSVIAQFATPFTWQRHPWTTTWRPNIRSIKGGSDDEDDDESDTDSDDDSDDVEEDSEEKSQEISGEDPPKNANPPVVISKKDDDSDDEDDNKKKAAALDTSSEDEAPVQKPVKRGPYTSQPGPSSSKKGVTSSPPPKTKKPGPSSRTTTTAATAKKNPVTPKLSESSMFMDTLDSIKKDTHKKKENIPKKEQQKVVVDDVKVEEKSKTIKSEDDKPNKKKKFTLSSSPSFASAASGKRKQPNVDGSHNCKFCDESFEKSSNLKNHVLNHFKTKILEDLPSSKPFICPTCQAPSRDKITLLRHYAFSHRIIYDHCSEADLQGRPSDEGPKTKPSALTPKTPKSTSSKKKDSSVKVSSSLFKSKTVISSSDSSSSSSSSEDEKKKKKSDNGNDVIKPIDHQPMFSDSDSDDLFGKATQGLKTKSFDDLFNGGGDSKKDDDASKAGERRRPGKSR